MFRLCLSTRCCNFKHHTSNSLVHVNENLSFPKNRMCLLIHSCCAYCEPLHDSATTRDLRSQIFVQQQNRNFPPHPMPARMESENVHSRDVSEQPRKWKRKLFAKLFLHAFGSVESDVRESKNSFSFMRFSLSASRAQNHCTFDPSTRRRPTPTSSECFNCWMPSSRIKIIKLHSLTVTTAKHSGFWCEKSAWNKMKML